MDGAEVYMLMIRKTGLPILGESMAALPFFQQVEVLDWNWKLVNQEQVEQRKKNDEAVERNSRSDHESVLDFNVLREEVEKQAANRATDQDEASRDLKKIIAQVDGKKMSVRDALAEIDRHRRENASSDKESNNLLMGAAEKDKAKYEKDKAKKDLANLEFSFSKRVDFASTQMLNCMKLGEILPRVVITIVHRSVSAPLLIVITAKNLRFLKYEVSVEVDDTMADMKEDWEAEFQEISFSYTNTRGVDQQKGRLTSDPAAGAKLALAAINTSSLFVMKSRD